MIKTSQLLKRFGNYSAVREVNLSVHEGEIFGFLGPNGAGKTTTLRMLTTLLKPDGGEISVAGIDIQKEPHKVRKFIGYVSQAGGSDRSATGREDLILQGRLCGMNAPEAKERAREIIELFALEHCADRFIQTYSGGEKRRLDIGLGVMHRPQVLFLDEPTVGLDPQNRANLWNQLRRLNQDGTTIFLTSHYLDEVDALSNRLAIMDKGVIVAVGSPRELKKEVAGDVVTVGFRCDEQVTPTRLERFKEHAFVRDLVHEGSGVRFYVSDGEAALPQIMRFLDLEQISVQTISLSLPSLDDVFLKKTGKSL
jgi:ABC-2 type transport system ATP-binding protein